MILRAYAKINLSLDVLRRREDGYHDIRMVMQTVGMYDRLELIPRPGAPGITLSVNLPYIPSDEGNLAFKAARLLMEEFHVEDGLSIQLGKFIPVAAGLGGGSSDAASVLYGVNRLFHLGLSREELMDRGSRIGADVPYCLLRGTALAEGIGEKLTPLPPLPDCSILLCKPPVNVSTREIYTRLALTETTVHPDVDGQIEAVKNGDLAGLVRSDRMKNVLESVTSSLYPVIHRIEELMLSSGALQSIMSGSGPSVFGIFDDADKAGAAADAVRAAFPGSRTFLTWPVNGGNHRRYERT